LGATTLSAAAVDAVAYHFLGIYVEAVSLHTERFAGHFLSFFADLHIIERKPIIFNLKASLVGLTIP
jgi:hypothetical membrane protein